MLEMSNFTLQSLSERVFSVTNASYKNHGRYEVSITGFGFLKAYKKIHLQTVLKKGRKRVATIQKTMGKKLAAGSRRWDWDEHFNTRWLRVNLQVTGKLDKGTFSYREGKCG